MKKTIAEINATLKELAEYTKMQEELETQIDSLKDKIKAYMTDENITELLGESGEKVYWDKVISSRFDSTAFKKSEWAELYKEYSKTVETRPFKFYAG